MAPNWRFEKMSEADRSTSAVTPRTVVVPLIAAPIRYGATSTFHLSGADCATAGVAAPAITTATSANRPIQRFTLNLQPEMGRLVLASDGTWDGRHEVAASERGDPVHQPEARERSNRVRSDTPQPRRWREAKP